MERAPSFRWRSTRSHTLEDPLGCRAMCSSSLVRHLDAMGDFLSFVVDHEVFDHFMLMVVCFELLDLLEHFAINLCDR